jgi:hypothetical protein
MATNVSRRFAETTEEEIQTKRLKLNADNTLKSNKKSANILREYTKEKNQDSLFENYVTVRLNETLAHFYTDLRKPDGGRYKSTSFESIRHGINRYLKLPPHDKKFDIVKDSDFTDVNTNFQAVMSEIKRMGLAEIDHHPVINEPDRRTLYTSIFMCTDTPSGLANIVQYDIRMYFFRRGMENMHQMTKSNFAVKTGMKYVFKTTDEMTKNHRENDKENSSGVMPESPGKVF